MPGVLPGFAVLVLVAGVGYLLARIGVLDACGQRDLNSVAFYVATPALLATVLAEAEVGTALAHGFVVAALSALVCAGLYLLVARRVWGARDGVGVVGALASSYVNAGNLGLPLLTYAVGSGVVVAPVMLLQLLVMAPCALTVLDRLTRRSDREGSDGGGLRGWARSIANPITVGCAVGLLLTLTEVQLPVVLMDAVRLLAAMAVPTMLLAYGVSLRVGPRAFASGGGAEVAVIAVLKLLVQPAVACGLAVWLFEMGGTDLLAVTLCAGLPTAQNIFVYASRYNRGIVVARDAIFATSVLSLGTLTVIALLLG